MVNATGIFTDCIRHMADPETAHMMEPSQGIHLVFEQSFLEGDTAVMVPHTSDGRVMFAIPVARPYARRHNRHTDRRTFLRAAPI